MTVCLLLLFVATLGYLVYFSLPGARRSASFPLGKLVTTGYLLFSALCVCALLVDYLGFPGEKAHMAVRHVEFRGVAVTLSAPTGNTSNVRISGDQVDADSEIKRSFKWFALSTGASVDVRPERMDGPRIATYRAFARHCDQIIRLSRKCINQSVGGWAPVGTTALYSISSAGDEKAGIPSSEVAFKIKVESGKVRVAGLEPVALRDRATLRDLLSASHASGLRESLHQFVESTGPSVLDRVQVVRYTKGDEDSPVALIYPAVGLISVQRTDVSATTDSAPELGPLDGKFRLEAYGLEGRNTLILPGTAESTKDGHVRLDFLFDPPRAYPLPPADLLTGRKGLIQLASSRIGKDGDGYVFDTGNLNEAFMTPASLSADGSKLVPGAGRSDEAQPVKLNESVVLGQGSVSPIFALVDPLAPRSVPWLIPVVALGVGLLLCFASFTRVRLGKVRSGQRAPRNLSPSHPAFVVWVVACTIVSVRAVLAFRVSVLPPFNMDTTSAASYHACWQKALAASTVLPILLGIGVYLAVRARELNSVGAPLSKMAEAGADLLARIAVRPWHVLARLFLFGACLEGLLQAMHKLIHRFPFPEASLYGVALLVLGLVLEGVSEARDDAFENLQKGLGDPPDLLGNLRAFLERVFDRGAGSGAKMGGSASGGPVGSGGRVTEGATLQTLNPYPLSRDKSPGRGELEGLGKLLSSLTSSRLIWATCVLLVFDDPGSALFIVPICFALCVAAMTSHFGNKKPGSAWPKLAVVGLGVALLGGFAVSPAVGARILTSPLPLVIGRSTAFPYRLVATDGRAAEALLLNPGASPGRFDPQEMQRVLLQRWEMKSYLKGAGSGYFEAPLSNSGMTYATMLSDAVFSVFLTGEHGRLAAAMTIGLLLLLAFAVFRAAWTSACSRQQRANVRGLYAIAGIVGGASVYMSLANLWAVPFTGQNVPLLSLDSYKDLVLNSSLLVAALLLIAFPGSGSDQVDAQSLRDARKSSWAWWMFPGLLTFGGICLIYQLGRIDGPATEPFNLGKQTLDGLQQVAEIAVRQARDQRTAIAETATVRESSAFVRDAIERLQAGATTQTPLMLDRGIGGHIVVDRRFYLVRSPFERDPGVAWHGSLLAAEGIRRHQILVSGSRTPVLLEPGKGAAVLVMGRPVKAIDAQSIDLEQQVRGRIGSHVDYGGIKLVDDRVILRWRTAGKPGTILINGERPNLPVNQVELRTGDVVSLNYMNPDGVPEQLAISYAGPTDSKLASVSWQNGKFSRSFPQGSDFPLAYTISEVGDDDAARAKKPIGDVQLSLDLQLQRDLQSTLRSWAQGRQRLINRGVRLADGLPFTALTVLDSYTGQVRALASLPQADPNEDLDTIRSRFTSDQDALTASRSSWDFVNRTIGSTVKPLGFTALCSQLDGKSFRLEDLKVDEAAAVEPVDVRGETVRSYRKLGDIELKRGKLLGAKENPRPEVDMFTYLRDSRTWPAIVTSTIGLVADRSDPKAQHAELGNMFSPSGSGSVWVGGERMAFRPREALSRLFVAGARLALNSVELDQTAYFQGIESCYGPNVVPFNFNETSRWDDGLEKGFLRPLTLSPTTAQSIRQIALPELHTADTTSLTDLDGQLLRYMIGAGECRWCALTMAANGARIVTGKRIQPTLSAQVPSLVADMPKPVNDFSGWRKPHILDPLQQITTMPAADAAAVRAAVAAGGYRIVMKTGTIDDGTGANAWESEMLMFTIGRYDERNGFVPGKSLSGFMSIRSAKRMEGDDMVKGDLARLVMPILVKYLQRHKA